MTETESAARASGISTCEADTTTDSAKALTCRSNATRVSSPALATIASGSLRKPSAATRSSYRPGATRSNWNSPSAEVSVDATTDNGPASTTRARGTRAPAGSVTVPRTTAVSGVLQHAECPRPDAGMCVCGEENQNDEEESSGSEDATRRGRHGLSFGVNRAEPSRAAGAGTEWTCRAARFPDSRISATAAVFPCQQAQ